MNTIIFLLAIIMAIAIYLFNKSEETFTINQINKEAILKILTGIMNNTMANIKSSELKIKKLKGTKEKNNKKNKKNKSNKYTQRFLDKEEKSLVKLNFTYSQINKDINDFKNTTDNNMEIKKRVVIWLTIHKDEAESMQAAYIKERRSRGKPLRSYHLQAFQRNVNDIKNLIEQLMSAS